MKKCDFILMILNCKAYKHKSNLQKETWLKNLPPSLPYYHVIGRPELHTDFEFNEDERILYVKTPDDYNSLPQKVICAYEAFYKTYDFKYIFKTDDDQQLVNDLFLPTIMQKLTLEKFHYGGHMVNTLNDHISKYYIQHDCLPRNILMKKGIYCNGRFYFLSKESIADLITKKEKFYTEYFEDYAVGYYLNSNLKSSILSINNGEFFRDVV
jgi:hypothetical protein